MEDNELFGERHEQEENGLYGKKHAELCDLHNVSGSLPCGCLKCSPNVFPNMRFNVCPICGNKRCPHASDHNYECTKSNDVGQTGSVYGGNDR